MQKLKDQLRVGTHLVLSGNRVIVSKRQIAYNSPTSTANKDLTIAANYYKLIGGRGQLTAHPPAVKASPTGRGISKTATTSRAKHRPVGDLEIPELALRQDQRAPARQRSG